MGSLKTKRLVNFEQFVHRDVANKRTMTKTMDRESVGLGKVKVLWMLLCWRFSKYKET